MMTKKYWLATLLTCASITACGGGSSGGGTTTPTASSNASSSVSAADFSAVAGVYDTSRETDGATNEQYLSISDAGLLMAYNYLGDSVNAGDNCYRESTGAESNAGISGQSLTANATDGTFSLAVSGTDLIWTIADGAVSRVAYGGISAGGTLSITSGGVALVIPTARTSTLTLADIEASLCQ